KHPRHYRKAGEMVGEVLLAQAQVLHCPNDAARFYCQDSIHQVETHARHSTIQRVATEGLLAQALTTKGAVYWPKYPPATKNTPPAPPSATLPAACIPTGPPFPVYLPRVTFLSILIDL